MSDNIPFDIQMQIIKWLPVKPLIQFRSVSKPWKSVIDSSEFIKGYGARHTRPRSRILSHISDYESFELRCICLVEDDIETIKVLQQKFVVSPLLKQFNVSKVVGGCHGLLCLWGYHNAFKNFMLVIWNPSIGKSFGIAAPKTFVGTNYGFGVFPVTSDPIVVRVVWQVNKPWYVEVFTLSSGVWNVIPSSNLPRQSIQLNSLTKVVIDRFIYWAACEEISTHDGEFTRYHMVVSFDFITKDFKVINLPDSLTNEFVFPVVSVSKLRGSLVVCANNMDHEFPACGVWVMEHNSSFRKLFTIGAPFYKILRFMKNDEPLFEIDGRGAKLTTLNVYEPRSQQIKNLGISTAVEMSFYMCSYKESLLLLDHSDLHIYSEDS